MTQTTHPPTVRRCPTCMGGYYTGGCPTCQGAGYTVLPATETTPTGDHACQWCGTPFPNNTAKAIHVHDAHPETIGRGRTRSAVWHCHACAAPNSARRTQCVQCGKASR